MASLLLKNIGLLATPTGSDAKRGKAQGEITLLKNAYVLVRDGVISAVGSGEVPAGYLENAEVVDAKGRLVTPGLVDAHTHLIFGGWRQNELGLKLHGVTYLEILAQGGGILSTVRSTRAASEEELADKAAKELKAMLAMGTTTCEAKSGYTAGGTGPHVSGRPCRAGGVQERPGGLYPPAVRGDDPHCRKGESGRILRRVLRVRRVYRRGVSRHFGGG